MKKVLLSLLVAVTLANAGPQSSWLIAAGPWPFCEAGYTNIPGCDTVVIGQEAYKILVVPSSPEVTNFKWALTGTRKLDGKSISLSGIFDRDNSTSYSGTISGPIATGELLPGYRLTVTERVDLDSAARF